MALLCWNMWELRSFTVDDAYISFRYARNLVDGHGLVFNIGERIEGYTNLLWTLILARGLQLGMDPHHVAKGLGSVSACGTLVAVYLLSRRMEPLRELPCIATWLVASSVVSSGYAVLGLEGALFSLLTCAGTLMFLREEDRGRGFMWSGPVFALAGLTRPEAPLFIGILMLTLGRGIVGRRNLLRGALFALPLVVHLAWRYSYYGAWLPATLTAKTGDLGLQYHAGLSYIDGYMVHAGAVVFFALFTAAIAIVHRRRDWLAVTAITAGLLVYLVVVGGDWMSYFRFFQPIEPFLYVMVGVGIRRIASLADRSGWIALAMFIACVAAQRTHHLQKAKHKLLHEEKRFWDNATGASSDWLLRNEPGMIAVGDIGRIGYETNYPLLDLLGLVDPVIGNLPGGHRKKLGPGFADRVFDVMPEYILLIQAGQECDKPQRRASRLLYQDERFRPSYRLGANIQVSPNVGWCIFKRSN
jgi:hypothetical protein